MIDATDDTFERDVLERSTEVPVIVDLWAEWCGPCKTLGPIIEKVVAETDGRVELVKVDVDANPRVSATFRVQSIPAVYALKDRRVVDNFIGAIPEAQVRAFVENLAPPPSEVDLLVERGDEASLRAALAMEPGHVDGVLSLANLLVDRGDNEEALALLARIPESAETRHVAARARAGSVVTSDNSDENDAKLEALLPRVKSDEDARQQFVDILELMGADDPRTAAWRKKLTSALF
ncbi:MAG TPA: tetratricopeptide repeat protein [Acidimicrobiales bacterium]|nr:tetratricopeptide repeat protein [Acidimicrobiales bacterium]